MKKLALALAVAIVGGTGAATSALAQDAIIRREGPYGSRTVIRRSVDDDVVVRRRRFAPDADVVVRRGGPRCRTVEVRRQNFRGDTVIKRTRRCD